MARSSKWLQLSGHRFLLLRMERALLRGDVHTDDDSPRAQSLSLIFGVVAAAVVVAVVAILSVLRPLPAWDGAGIVMVDGSGAMYVRVDEVAHPVLNLTSARLIAGTADPPRRITAAALQGTRRGVLVGIPGAPAQIGLPLTEEEFRWTVCDRDATTVIAGDLGPAAHPLGPHQAILVSGPSGTTYLLYGGRRARVDLADRGVVAALGADGVQPALVSRALLDLVPEVAPIVTPQIPGFGTPAPAALPGFTVGEVVQVRGAADTEFYVVLDGGVQRIGQVAADVLRRAGSGSSITAVAPASLEALPRLGTLSVTAFPERVDEITPVTQTVCASWRAGATELLTGSMPLGPQQNPVRLAQADGAGPYTDAVYVPAGRAAHVSDGTRAAPGWLVTDLGTRFGVADADCARILALADPVTVPRAVVDALPRGPELSRSAALAAYDGVFTGTP